MFDFLKRKKENFPVLTEEAMSEIRRIAISPPPQTCDGIILKKDFERWEYSRYMYKNLKDSYYRRLDEEKEKKRVERELARLRELERAKMIVEKQQEEQRMAAEAKRKEEIKETFQEMEEIVKEIRDD
jgi:predicted transcriptional regulator